MTTATATARARLAAGLKDAARLLRDHPDLPLPIIGTGARGVTLAWYCDAEYDDPRDQAALWVRIGETFGPLTAWTPYAYAASNTKAWEREVGHLRLIVTYRLAERAS